MAKSYFIKDGYRINIQPVAFDDSAEASRIYQREVYQFAAACAKRFGARTVIDIGCGYGTKLGEFFAPLGVEIVGIDGERAIDYCRTHHAFGRWFVENVEQPRFVVGGTFDLIIGVDVIEHLLDPDLLLAYMRQCAHAGTHLVLSTPERDLRRGPDSSGPPQNRAHVREWNQAEFAAYLADRGLNVREHHILDLREGMRCCQAVLAQFA